jgi:integrase/recombinase XerD
VSIEPGRIPAFLTNANVGLLRAEDRVFEAMLDGWRAQMLARGLSTSYIKSSCGTIQKFQEHANEYPWTWSAHHVDEFLADRRSSEKGLALSTLRTNSGAIRAFCSYLTDGRHGWATFCERVFADIPVQVVFEWNSPRHTTDDALPARRRAFTRTELQTFFDAADDLVDTEFAKGSKRWLPAFRDSTAFKVAYAYGLRRRELVMLEYVDFGPNPHVVQFGRFGAVQVRWAKGTKGSGPRRRTVLTVPEFDWVVGLLEHWLSPDGRKRFPTADRSASLWPFGALWFHCFPQLRPVFSAGAEDRRTAGGTDPAHPEALVRYSSDRGRLRPAVYPATGRAQLLLDHSPLYFRVGGLQTEDHPENDRPAATQRRRRGERSWLNSDGSATAGTSGN